VLLDVGVWFHFNGSVHWKHCVGSCNSSKVLKAIVAKLDINTSFDIFGTVDLVHHNRFVI
jgi:hypothetical protein